MTTEPPDDLDDGEGPDPDEMHRRFLASYEEDYQASGNPLYVWEAVSCCAHEALTRAIFSRAATAEAWDTPAMSLPPWVLRYLTKVARELDFLKQGLDRRMYPHDTPDASADDGAEASARWRMNPTLNFKQALARVPNALGLVRRGWNAFRDREARRAKRIDLEDLMYGQLAGLTARQVRERLMDELGLKDERSIRRRLSQARREIQAAEGSGPDALPKSDPDQT